MKLAKYFSFKKRLPSLQILDKFGDCQLIPKYHPTKKVEFTAITLAQNHRWGQWLDEDDEGDTCEGAVSAVRVTITLEPDTGLSVYNISAGQHCVMCNVKCNVTMSRVECPSLPGASLASARVTRPVARWSAYPDLSWVSPECSNTRRHSDNESCTLQGGALWGKNHIAPSFAKCKKLIAYYTKSGGEYVKYGVM